MVFTTKIKLTLDLYYMQGNIHLNQFRARVKSNRSGGEDDLTLAIDHFRVSQSQKRLTNRKTCCFIQIDGGLGTLSLRRIHSNRKVPWAGQPIASTETVKPSRDTNESTILSFRLTLEINSMLYDGDQLLCPRDFCFTGF